MDADLLLLVRHGMAEDRHPGGDAARALTAEGAAAFRAAAALVAARARPGRVLTSPYLRAAQTAEILAAAVGAPVEPHDELGCAGATPHGMAALARPGVALVGHNPTITEAAALLLGCPESRLRFRPGTVMALAREGDGWALRWTLSA